MSPLQTALATFLARFDDEAYAALSSRGLVRRARKDLERVALEVARVEGGSISIVCDGHRVAFDARGPAHAQCDCPATGVCQHILVAAMWLQAGRSDAVASSPDPLASLHAELMALTPEQMIGYAGRADYRWAWHWAQDLDPVEPLRVSGESYLLLSFERPRFTARYVGGGLASLILEGNPARLQRYRVAAVLAYQRAQGRIPPEPPPTPRARGVAATAAAGGTPATAMPDATPGARARLRSAVLGLLVECIELGLAHLSEGMQERFATLAVWAQGVDYPRLAALLRRCANHIEWLLQRAAAADSQVLFDEFTLAYALIAALESAARNGTGPAHLIGRSRSHYDKGGTLALLGLGAYAWRSAAGYVGLTMMFWCPALKTCLSCSDARPVAAGGFDPVGRYRAAGPWSGLAAPASATGRRIVLVEPPLSESGRLSAATHIAASVSEVDAAEFVQQLDPVADWNTLDTRLALDRPSLLQPAQPMQGWVTLRPASFHPALFDGIRQTLVWQLEDAYGKLVLAELPYGEYSAHAIGRIEALSASDTPAGTLLVACYRGSRHGHKLFEPLSLVSPQASRVAVDALHFDAAPTPVTRSRPVWQAPTARDASPAEPLPAPACELSRRISACRDLLLARAERGIPAGAVGQGNLANELSIADCARAGFPLLQTLARSPRTDGALLLRMNYVAMQGSALRANRR